MEFNWEDFKNSNGKIAVHCKTEEEAEEFIKECFKHGIKWCYSDENTTHWEEVNKRTYYVYSGRHLYYGNGVSNPNEITVVEYKEDNKMELKEGMIVECRNGSRYLLRKVRGNLLLSANEGWDECTYDNNFVDIGEDSKEFNGDYDIMKIYESNAHVLVNLFDDDFLECIWERKEPKKMTLAQISEALGYEVEVIDNE